MNRRAFPFSIVLVFLSLPAWGQLMDTPVAVVELDERVPIGQRAVREQVTALEAELGRTLTDAERREVLNGLVNGELLSQGAARAGITISDAVIDQAIAQQQLQAGVTEVQFRQLIESQTGLSYSEYREELRETLRRQQYVVFAKPEVLGEIRPPSDIEVQEFYDDNRLSFSNPAMTRFTHLFVDTRTLNGDDVADARDRADRLYRRIRAGGRTAFNQLVAEAADDPSYQAGDFGYLVRNDAQSREILGREFVNAVFALNAETVSAVLESNLGYHIVFITDKRDARLLDIDDPVYPGQSVTVRDQIEQYLVADSENVAFQRALEELIEELTEEAQVNIYEQYLNW